MKIQFYGFVGNIDADLGLTWFPHRTLYDRSRGYLIFENGPFFQNMLIFFLDKAAQYGRFLLKKVRESWEKVSLTRIHDIGHTGAKRMARGPFSPTQVFHTKF